MGNIITYVRENGHMAFDELGFNEVDSLILSQLSYLDFSCCTEIPQPFGATIATLRQMGLAANCPSNRIEANRCDELYDLLESSRRFRDIAVDNFVNDIDIAVEKQFSAVTFRLSPRLHYIAFRGTDSTFVGWKEDFNMSFLADTPAQQAAVRYFEDIAGRTPGSFILGGHSKGGNLAVYAAMSAVPIYQQRISLVYEHDGPGFLEETLQRPGFRAVASRIYKTVPESAVVGLLLTSHEKYTVVASKAIGLFQHDPFTWQVENGDFVEVKSTDLLSKAADRTMTLWLSENDAQTRRAFIDGLYSLVQATGAHTLNELADNWHSNILPVFQAIRSMDPSVRRMILETVFSLLRASGKGVRETLESEFNQMREEIKTELNDRLQKLVKPK